MLDPEVFLESFEGGQGIVVEPDSLEVGEVLEVGEDVGFSIS